MRVRGRHTIRVSARASVRVCDKLRLRAKFGFILAKVGFILTLKLNLAINLKRNLTPNIITKLSLKPSPNDNCCHNPNLNTTPTTILHPDPTRNPTVTLTLAIAVALNQS